MERHGPRPGRKGDTLKKVLAYGLPMAAAIALARVVSAQADGVYPKVDLSSPGKDYPYINDGRPGADITDYPGVPDSLSQPEPGVVYVDPTDYPS